MVKLILMTITKPSFNDINLMRSMWAAYGMSRRRGGVTIAAAGRRRPPWSGCIFLPSFRLANCVSDVRPPKTQQKYQPMSDQISPSIFSGMGHLKYPSSAHLRGGNICAVWLYRSVILGSAALGEASETMVELCLWGRYRIFT